LATYNTLLDCSSIASASQQLPVIRIQEVIDPPGRKRRRPRKHPLIESSSSIVATSVTVPVTVPAAAAAAAVTREKQEGGRKHGDQDAFSSENEFSVGGLSLSLSPLSLSLL